MALLHQRWPWPHLSTFENEGSSLRTQRPPHVLQGDLHRPVDNQADVKDEMYLQRRNRPQSCTCHLLQSPPVIQPAAPIGKIAEQNVQDNKSQGTRGDETVVEENEGNWSMGLTTQ